MTTTQDHPLAGLVAAFDAEAARVRDRNAPQSHAAHGQCPGGLQRDCTQRTPQRECTAEEGQRWQQRRTDGYAAARGAIAWNQAPRIELTAEPAELPHENGAQYVARHVGIAWELGYSSAWRWHNRAR